MGRTNEATPATPSPKEARELREWEDIADRMIVHLDGDDRPLHWKGQFLGSTIEFMVRMKEFVVGRFAGEETEDPAGRTTGKP